MSTYAKQVAKEEVKKEMANINLQKVGMEAISGKTTTLELAMEEATGRIAAKICGQGALNKVSPYLPYMAGGGLLLAGYFAYKYEKGK
jgi:hypothetical protein